jgi:hypothetical protein
MKYRVTVNKIPAVIKNRRTQAYMNKSRLKRIMMVFLLK